MTEIEKQPDTAQPCMNGILPASGPSAIRLGEWSVTNLERIPEADWHLIPELLQAARDTQLKAQPLLSRYTVGAAGMTEDGRIGLGCNLEYGAGFGKADATAIHAEESMVTNGIVGAGLTARTGEGSGNPLKYIATTGCADTPIPACGNCLDILKTFSTPETLMITEMTGSRAAVLTFEECLPVIFPVIEQKFLTDDENRALTEAIRAMDIGFDLFTRDSCGRSGAAIISESGRVYAGARDDRADFHSVSSLSAAVHHARSLSDPFPAAIAFASESGYLRGKDRQAVYEFAQAVQKEDSLPVILFNSRLETCFRVTPRQLLPYAFGARDLGMTEEVNRFMSEFRKTAPAA